MARYDSGGIKSFSPSPLRHHLDRDMGGRMVCAKNQRLSKHNAKVISVSSKTSHILINLFFPWSGFACPAHSGSAGSFSNTCRSNEATGKEADITHNNRSLRSCDVGLFKSLTVGGKISFVPFLQDFGSLPQQLPLGKTIREVAELSEMVSYRVFLIVLYVLLYMY